MGRRRECPNLATGCPVCGWRLYPRPEPLPDDPMTVRWVAPDVCDRCGGTLIQRSDDSEEIIRNRLREYGVKTRPVLDYFEKAKWPVRRIDATGNMDQIFGRIYAAVLLS